MSDLTAAEARRCAVNGVPPIRMSSALAAGVWVRVLHYPGLPNRCHPDDDAKLRTAVKAAKEIQDIVRDAP